METTAKTTTEYLKNLLTSKGVKPSFQRLSVLKYLMDKKGHPSVDTIYQSLINEIPTLSRTTVYNTLNLLTEKDVVTALTIDETEVRYDYIEEPHSHFQCMNCSRIVDIGLNSNIYSIENVDGHRVLDTQINFKGICKNCLNEQHF